MIEYLVHYEKHNQMILWIHLWIDGCSEDNTFFTPIIWQDRNIILQYSYVYWTEILTFTVLLPRRWRMCALGERDRDLWKGSYGFENEVGWCFRSGIKMARKSCLINSPKHGHEPHARNRTGFTGHQEVVKSCRGTSVQKCCSLQDLGQLAVPVRIYLDCWSNAASKRYKDRPKPSLLLFSPLSVPSLGL